MAQICKIQWRFPEAKPLSSQVISNRHKHTLENTRSCEKSISTEINSEHTRNLNGTLEITKKKKKTTTTTLQGISTGKNVLARTSKAKGNSRHMKHQNTKLLHSKGNSEDTTCPSRGNTCQLHIDWMVPIQRVTTQNNSRTQKAVYE